MYIAWGIPAVILGVLVFLRLPDWPREAHWLTPDERDALERELIREKEHHKQGHRHMTVLQALQHPQVLLLAAAYFFVVTASYGVEFFLPSILENWYDLPLSKLTWAMLIPPIGGLIGQLLVGWSSDRTGERRLHGSMPIYAGAVALGCTLLIPASLSFNMRLALAVLLFTMALMGLKAYMPAFWALPSLILTESAAAGSIGLINSVGNLGGFVGPFLLGYIRDRDSLVLARSSLPLLLDDRLSHDYIHPSILATAPPNHGPVKKLRRKAYPTKNPTPSSNLSESMMLAEEQRLGWASSTRLLTIRRVVIEGSTLPRETSSGAST